MYVTFCGHGEIPHTEEVKSWLREVLKGLFSEGVEIYYLGGYGAFDLLAASVLREMKSEYSGFQMVLVLPYLNTNMNTEKYDYTVYPPLESVPLRFAISKRN